jgi:sulfite reductase alpha subunit-like flavoprotein
MIFHQELYQDWIVDSHRTVLHVLEDLPSVKPTIDHLCELLPRLQARYYSISSSPKVGCCILMRESAYALNISSASLVFASHDSF